MVKRKLKVGENLKGIIRYYLTDKYLGGIFVWKYNWNQQWINISARQGVKSCIEEKVRGWW